MSKLGNILTYIAGAGTTRTEKLEIAVRVVVRPRVLGG